MNKIIIGLTGPTGSGKSTVSEEFKKAGCAVIDADLVARKAVNNNKCITALKAEFGNDIVDENNNLNRHLLAKRAFSNNKSTQKLNRITHPIIINEIEKQVEFYQRSNVKAIVIDAALLFESGSDSICTAVVAVTATIGVRLKRIIKRDSISLELAKARAGAQHENSYYNERAKYKFDGSTHLDDIPPKVNQLLKQIIGDYS